MSKSNDRLVIKLDRDFSFRKSLLELLVFLLLLIILISAKTEVGLVYDAVRLFAKALHDLDQTQAISIRPISCETEEPWQYGNAVTNYMRMV